MRWMSEGWPFLNTSIHTLLLKIQVRWAGHVVRMPEHRLPKQLLYGELSQGRRSAGGQKKRFKDSLKRSLKALNIDVNNWETSAMNRPTWRHTLAIGALAAETCRTVTAQGKCADRKAQAASSLTTSPTNVCPSCGRKFRARIGLTSHLRTHK